MLNVSLLNAQCGNLYISGIMDAQLTGGTPKTLQLCATGNIADLSIYGIGSANNGGGTDGEEFTFPADAINAGDCIWIGFEGSNAGSFNSFMGFDACYINSVVNVNGDDAIELFCSGAVIDVFGEIAVDGSGQPWEYTDGWAVSNDMAANPTWDITEWTFSGTNALDNETTNATAVTPYPNTMVMCPMAPPASDIILISELSLCTNTVELFNGGTTTVDVSAWELCNFSASPRYADIASLTVTGSTMMAPGDYITIQWSSITGLTGELGLYINGSGFGNPANIHDYIQYNAGGNARASVAVTAGVWDDAANFVTVDDMAGCATVIANATDPAAANSGTWCEAQTSTLGMANSACASNIVCAAVGDLIITEIMYNPSGTEPAAEWFEVCNTTASDIDMDGFEIGDAGATNHLISGTVVVPANGCIVISHTDVTVCGGASSAYQHGAFSLSQSGDEVEIICNGLSIDLVAYDGGGSFPSEGNGESIKFDSSVSQDPTTNDDGSNWCLSTTVCGTDFGTPGVVNPICMALCGVTFLAGADIICMTTTAGVDMVTVEVVYGGMDANAVLNITVNGGAVANAGDDPTVTNGGTISFTALEGDMYAVTFTDALCMSLSSSGTISTTQCPDPAVCGDLYFLGSIDGPLSGGTPKGVQLCASASIADLSVYGLESVTNGSGASSAEYTLPADPLNAGECIWIASEGVEFMNFFGFAPCYTTGVVGINGDDAIVLYCAGGIVDVLGDPDCDPNASSDPMVDCGIWEYQDGWIFASDNVQNPVFDDTEWTYSGENALDGELTNAAAAAPYPMPGTMCPDVLFPTGGCPDDYASGGLPNSQAPLTGNQDATADFEAAGDIESNQVIGSVTSAIMVDYDSGTSILLTSDFETVLGVAFHAFIDGCGGAMAQPNQQNQVIKSK